MCSFVFQAAQRIVKMFLYLITFKYFYLFIYHSSVSCYEVSKDEPQTGIIFGAAANWVRLVPFFDVWAHCRARSPWRETARLIDLVTKGEWDTFLDTFFSSLVALMKEACREKLSLGLHLKIARASLHLYVWPSYRLGANSYLNEIAIPQKLQIRCLVGPNCPLLINQLWNAVGR